MHHYWPRRRRAPCAGPSSSSGARARNIVVGANLLLRAPGPQHRRTNSNGMMVDVLPAAPAFDWARFSPGNPNDPITNALNTQVSTSERGATVSTSQGAIVNGTISFFSLITNKTWKQFLCRGWPFRRIPRGSAANAFRHINVEAVVWIPLLGVV